MNSFKILIKKNILEFVKDVRELWTDNSENEELMEIKDKAFFPSIYMYDLLVIGYLFLAGWNNTLNHVGW